jgi:hypothetical protein
VLAHKLREVMASATRALRIGGGTPAELDGAYFGGHIRRRTWLSTAQQVACIALPVLDLLALLTRRSLRHAAA